MSLISFDSPEVHRDFLKIQTYAMENIYNVVPGVLPDWTPPENNSEHVCKVYNIKIVYSINRYPEGLWHHLIISTGHSRLAHPMTVDKIMHRFDLGAIADSKQRKVWMGHDFDLHVMQPFTDEYQ